MRRWFRVWYAGRMSRNAHSLSVEWRGPEDGEALPACGTSIYDNPLFPDARLIAFVVAADDEPRCPECEAAISEQPEEAAA